MLHAEREPLVQSAYGPGRKEAAQLIQSILRRDVAQVEGENDEHIYASGTG